METTSKKETVKRKNTISRATLTRNRGISFAESSTCQATSTSRINPSKEDQLRREKSCQEYENEYSLYLLRLLQKRITEIENKEREEEAKKNLVALKREYQGLLEENVKLYEQCKMNQFYGEAIESVERDLIKGRELLRVLEENHFLQVLKKVNQDLEEITNNMELVDLKEENIQQGFQKNLLGFDSPIYKLLLQIKDYKKSRGEFVAEIVEEVKEIERVNAENETLRKRCCELAEEVRSNTIRKNYEKYYPMALELCKDAMGTDSMTEKSCLGIPKFSSTPN